MSNYRYVPSSTPGQAAEYLICELRSIRRYMSPTMKKGFTCLEKQPGLVRRVRTQTAREYDPTGGIVYAPGPGFWAAVERWGMTKEGHATLYTERSADQEKLWQHEKYPGRVGAEELESIRERAALAEATP